MREVLLAIQSYLIDDVGGLRRIDKKVQEIATAWALTIENPRSLTVGYDQSGQYPALAILPQTLTVQWASGLYSLARKFQVVIGVAAGDLESGVVLNTLLAYNSAVEQLLYEDETLGNRVTSARLLNAEFSGAIQEQKFYQTIDMIVEVTPSPNLSEQV